MGSKVKEPSKLDIWADKYEGEIIVTLIIVMVLVMGGYWINDALAREQARLDAFEERIAVKTEYLTTDTFTQFDIVDVEWERRVGSKLFDTTDDIFIFDLFLAESSDGELSRIAVYDTSVGDKYLVKPYEPAD